MNDYGFQPAPDEGRHSHECLEATRSALYSRLGIALAWIMFGAFTYIAWVSTAGGSLEPMIDAIRRLTLDQAVEAGASFFGVAGTLLLATKGRRAGWGFVAFLASNIGWLWFARAHGHQFMFWQQVAFTVSSVVGICVWLLKDWIVALFAVVFFWAFGELLDDDEGV